LNCICISVIGGLDAFKVYALAYIWLYVLCTYCACCVERHSSGLFCF
jgi:hypothetical protein